MGDWKTISTVGSGSTPATPDAPNVLNTGGTLTTAAVAYGLLGNWSAYQFTGSISLDMANPNIGHLKKIHVIYSITGMEVATLLQPNGGWASSPVTFASDWYFQDGSSHGGTLKFECENDVGNQTASPVSVSVTVGASLVTGVAASETGPLTADPVNRLVSTKIGIVATFANGQVPQNFTFWISADNGTTYVHLGWQLVSTVGQSIGVARLVPGEAQNWKVAAIVGPVGGNPIPILEEALPAGVVVSSSFAVAGLALPAASAVTTAAIAAGPYNAFRSNGSQYVRIPGATWTDAASDPNAAFVRITGQCVDASGNPAPADQGGTEVPLGGPIDPLGDVVSAGAVRQTEDLLFDYNPEDSVYIYYQFRMYVQNRNSTSTADWSDNTKSVLQTTAWSGAAYKRVLFGAKPADVGGSPKYLADEWGQGLVRGVDGLPWINSGNLSNLVFNSDFSHGLAGWAQTVANWSIYTSGGNNFATTTGNGTYLYQEVSARAGDQFHCEVDYSCATSPTGSAVIQVYFLDGTGALVGTQPIVLGAASFAAVTIRLDVTVPAGAVKIRAYFGVYPGSTGAWFFDNAVVSKQPSGGDGVMLDGFGGLKARVGGAYVDVDGSGNLRVTGASLDSTRLAAGSLGDLSKYSSTVRAIGVVFGLPSLPDSAYPQGAIIFNTSDSKIYRNTTGSVWSKGSDPADVIAGTLAAGVVYAGAVVATQVTAGTFAAGVVYAGTVLAAQIVAGTISVTSSSAMLAVKYTGSSLQSQMFPGSIWGYSDGNVNLWSLGCGPGATLAQLALSDTAGHLSILQAGIGLFLDASTKLYIGGNQVMGTRIGTRPVTLADVINAGVTHGWWA